MRAAVARIPAQDIAMALPASSPAYGWRTLSNAELAATPDARLGGELAIIVAIAATIAASKGLLYVLYVIVVSGLGGRGLPDMIGMFASGGSKSAWIQNLNLAVPALMFVFGVAVTAMTWLRARATPNVAGALVATWVAIAMIVNVLKRMVVATEGFDIFDCLQMAPTILFNIMMAVGFWGYMQQGRRPNLFYRRRVRV
jgi:hypothetical protein